VGQIAYQVPMLVAIAAMVVLTIVGTILMGVGTGIGIEMSGKGTSEDIGRTDERDREISRRGVLAGYVAASVGAVGALAITMLRVDHFWIANTLYLSFVASSLVSGITKLVAYRRGF
jgi:preprotein translocase subunit SecG